MSDPLAELTRAADPALAPYAAPQPPPSRFAGTIEDPTRLFVLEAVLEGHLLHYGTPRAFEGMDEDLRLLAGDADGLGQRGLGLDGLAAYSRPGLGQLPQPDVGSGQGGLVVEPGLVEPGNHRR